MFVAVFPASPSPSLTAALIDAGYQPVPVEGADALARRRPPDGWDAAVVELGEDPGLAILTARKMQNDHGLRVLVVADRLHTADLADHDGFDDFVLSPIDRIELRVRMSRLGASPTAHDSDDLAHHEDLELNTATYQATIGGKPCDLTYMEYELLRFFVENPGRVWSREQILSKVWGYDYFGGSRTVDVHVRRLRAKLGEERASWITTVRSVGYRFG